MLYVSVYECEETLSFLPYVKDGNYFRIDDHPYTWIRDNITDKNTKYIFYKYSRTQAIKDGVIVPLKFRHIDGKARFIDTDGREVETETLSDAKNSKKALRASVKTKYSLDLIPGLSPLRMKVPG